MISARISCTACYPPVYHVDTGTNVYEATLILNSHSKYNTFPAYLSEAH